MLEFWNKEEALKRICCHNGIPFPKLERLDVRECGTRLQYFFCLSLAGSSSKLEDLKVAFPDDDEEKISRSTHIELEGKMVQAIKFPNLSEMHLEFLKCLTFAMTLLRALNSLSYKSCTSSTYLSSRITGLHPTKATLPQMQILFLMKRFLVPV